MLIFVVFVFVIVVVVVVVVVVVAVLFPHLFSSGGGVGPVFGVCNVVSLSVERFSIWHFVSRSPQKRE